MSDPFWIFMAAWGAGVAFLIACGFVHAMYHQIGNVITDRLAERRYHTADGRLKALRQIKPLSNSRRADRWD